MFAPSRNALARIGDYVWEIARVWRYLAAVVATVLFASLKPRHWPRTVRSVFARQLLFSGVGAVPFVLFVAALVGMEVVVETYSWLRKFGGTEGIGALLVVIVGRELGPLFVNVIVIVRSGSAMASELAVMQVSGDVRALEAQGIDPFLYLLMPRVLAMTLATFCLTAIFNVAAFASGYGFGAFIQVIPDSPSTFLESVFGAVAWQDVISVVAKSIVPPILTGVICASEGLSAVGSVTAVPSATKRALSRSVVALFIAFVVISMMTYK